MSVETSKQSESASSHLGKKITDGRRKGETYREALLLQDVFSDSGNASGSSQKTSSLPKTGQVKRAQLEGKAKRKSTGTLART